MLTFQATDPSEADTYAFSTVYKSKSLKLNETKLIANGYTGYSSVLATCGVREGTVYYEATILNPSSDTLDIPHNPIPSTAPILEPLLSTEQTLHLETLDYRESSNHRARTRIGFATTLSDLETPVGADLHGYSYRDTDGKAFHDGCGKSYGAAYSYLHKDIVGCLIHLQPQKPKIKGTVDFGLTRSEGSYIRFFVNGQDQGVAYQDIFEGCYFPAVGLYQYARIELNLSANVKYPHVLEEFNARTFAEI